MQSEEQRLIDGLFSRLKQAEEHSAPRDATAESVIAQHVQSQPAAPYYMTQTILIQEAAIKQLNERIQALESEASQLRETKQSSGGFLAGLFGGGQSSSPARGSDPIPGAQNYASQSYASQSYAPQNSASPNQNYAQAPNQYAPAARGGSSFMSGALQTAAGVAGGVVIGNMLMNMFSGTHPQEIVNIIEEPPAPAASDLTPAADASFLPQDGSDYASEVNNDDWGNNDDFGSNDDFGNDDDSWV
ncbi:DUF2076 domain-containing protein [[Enterobacter] lignolyticus]|uniref:ABC transporter substrate-binding protein n=1 Tax=[Enterobacter] lignolyticus TaxID=1334193 RepID=A0A806X2I7_9ENTR|nr:DUF2076 domain-containing protein [[Enterobacter] lignolyticus]ALR75660.1 ABC transporter substrate-binding protein [[Enterobacter] lignolyticus]